VKKRVCAVFGTRPEAVKMAPVVLRLRQTPGVADVRYDREWLDRLQAAINVIRAIGLLLALFPLGTIAGSLALRAAGPSLAKRRTLFAAHAAGSLCIAAAGLAEGFPLAVACISLWGVCGGVAINCGRALLLERRTPAQHGRLLANLQLALLLASPVGAVIGGATASGLGLRGSMVALGLGGLAGTLSISLARSASATICPAGALKGERADPRRTNPAGWMPPRCS